MYPDYGLARAEIEFLTPPDNEEPAVSAYDEYDAADLEREDRWQ